MRKEALLEIEKTVDHLAYLTTLSVPAVLSLATYVGIAYDALPDGAKLGTAVFTGASWLIGWGLRRDIEDMGLSRGYKVNILGVD